MISAFGRPRALLCSTFLLLLVQVTSAIAEERVVVTQKGTSEGLRGPAIGLRWSISDGTLRDVTLEDGLQKRTLGLEEPFSVLLKDGRIYKASNLRCSGPAVRHELMPDAASARLAGRLRGEQLDVDLRSEDGALNATLVGRAAGGLFVCAAGSDA